MQAVFPVSECSLEPAERAPEEVYVKGLWKTAVGEVSAYQETTRKLMIETCPSGSKRKLWEEHKKKNDLTRKIRWENEIADRKKIIVVNLKTKEEVEISTSYRYFCEERNISYKAFSLMILGKTKTSGGWYIKGTDPTHHSQKGEIRKPLSEEHKQKISSGNKLHEYTGRIVISPNGKSYIIPSNLTSFCEEHDLPRTTLGYMLKGERDNCKGWHLPEQDLNLIQVGKHFTKIVLSPDGQEHTGIKSIKDFCDLYGLNRPGFTDLLNEKSLSYRGWKLKL
jgi:hypothetical protein